MPTFYLPAVGEFDIQISNAGGSDRATFTKDAVVVNLPPDTNPSTGTAEEDGSTVSINVLSNDSDPEGEDLTVTGVSKDSGPGAVSVVGNQVQFVPAGTGTTVVTYTVSDGTNSVTETLTITTFSAGDVGTLPTLPTQTVKAGENHTLDLDWGSGATSVAITSQPSNGAVAVNDDLTLQCQLAFDSFYSGSDSFDVQVGYSDASQAAGTVNLTIEAKRQYRAMPPGLHYQLMTTTADLSVIEPGENHRIFYVSGLASEAWTIAEIEAEESITADGAYLFGQSAYGTTSQPFAEDAAFRLLNHCRQTSSHPYIMYLKRGYSYSTSTLRHEDGNQDTLGTPLHPSVIGAWGTGTRPAIPGGSFGQGTNKPANYMYHSLQMSGVSMVDQGVDRALVNSILENIYIPNAEINWQGWSGTSWRNVLVPHVFRSSPIATQSGIWTPLTNRKSGMYTGYGEDMLLHGCAMLRGGYNDGYNWDQNQNDPHPFTEYSHGFYTQGKSDRRNTTNILSDGLLALGNSLSGGQLRPGMTGAWSVWAENNQAFISGVAGNYLCMDLVLVVGAGFKVSERSWDAGLNRYNGIGYSGGIELKGDWSSLTRCLVCHSIDPNNASTEKPLGSMIGAPSALHETKTAINSNFASGAGATPGVNNFGGFIPAGGQDWTVHNWKGGGLTGTVDSALINDVTMRKFAATEMGGTPTREEFMDWIRDEFIDENINIRALSQRWVRSSMPARYVTVAEPTVAATCTAIAPPHKDGINWNMPGNWDTGDRVPGELFRDNVDLNGLKRSFNFGRAHVNNLTFSGSTLYLYGGGLIANQLIGARVESPALPGGGQLHVDGALSGDNVINMQGGRFLNFGTLTGNLDLTASGEEIVFAYADDETAAYTVSSGSTVELQGGVLAGFDGSGGASATMTVAAGGTLRFEAVGGVLPTIKEFRTGINGTAAPSVASTFNCGGTIQVDVSGMSSGTYDLVDVDAVSGTFGTETITGGSGSIGYTAAKVRVTVS